MRSNTHSHHARIAPGSGVCKSKGPAHPAPEHAISKYRTVPAARPTWNSDQDDGRFIACRTGFYDPAVFEPNREVTFTGRIDGYDTRKIGGYDYRFPRIAADVVYLWPIRERVDVITRPAPWPWWGWW